MQTDPPVVREFTFGTTTCEVLVQRTLSGETVAWALKIQPNGARDPLFDREYRLFRELAGTEASAVETLRSRLASMLGLERPQ